MLSNDIMADQEIIDLAESARIAKKEFDLKVDATEHKILEWLKLRMPVGSIINTKGTPNSDNPRPPYLLNVKVMSGNARGTGLFRIERIRNVELHPNHLDLSRWNCEVTPISEKTGKDMSASPGNKRSNSEFVTLRGYIGRLD